METIPIDLILWVAVSAMIVGTLYWIFRPHKCPKCGATMFEVYEIGKGVSSYECPRCGYNEEAKE